MNPIQPVGDSAAGITTPRADRTAELAGTSQATATQASTAMEVSSTLNVTMVYSQVDAMLSNVGGGTQDNQLLRMVIALMIMQALLAEDGGSQQSGANALMDLLGLSGGSGQSGMIGLHSATNVIQIQQQSTVLMTGQAAIAPTATEGDPDRSGDNIDLSA